MAHSFWTLETPEKNKIRSQGAVIAFHEYQRLLYISSFHVIFFFLQKKYGKHWEEQLDNKNLIYNFEIAV